MRGKEKALGFINEFKQFAFKGNLVDTATGIIIGASMGKVVSSLVENIIMPPLGLMLGGVAFKDLNITLKPAVNANDPAVVLSYGMFLQNVIDFTIIAFVIFLVIKTMVVVRLQQKKEEKNNEPTKEEKLLTEIRDLLKKSTK